MAFLTSRRGSGVVPVKNAFELADGIIVQIKNAAQAARAAAAANTMTSRHVIDNLMPLLVNGRAQLVTLQTVPGLAAYANEQYADVPGYNVGTEFTAMMAAVDSTITFFTANWPKDADNNLKHLSFNGSGALVPLSSFTVGQRNAIVAQLDSLLATID